MRMKKIKSRVSLVGALKHDTREWEPKNADPKRMIENAYTASSLQAIEKYGKILPEKVRKNAVHAIEVVLTSSPEWFETASKKNVQLFVNKSRAWLYKLFGQKNELLLAVHMDEKTPHIHAIFMPLVDGKLNAKELIGGSRNRMRDLQDDFFFHVGKPLGMERGVRNESIRHTEPKELPRLLKEVEKRNQEIEQKENEFEKVKGITPTEIKKLKEDSVMLDTWRKKSPEFLIKTADDYKKAGAKNGYEFIETMKKVHEQSSLNENIQNPVISKGRSR